MTTPLVSVIIVNYNGNLVLPRCLAALAAQTFQDFEIIVVDNGSSDFSLGTASFSIPVKMIELGNNTGFAYANNRGVEKAEGEWVALLNNDAFPEPSWLEVLIEAVKKYPDYDFFGSHQYIYNRPGVLDGTGDMFALSGRAWRRDHMISTKNAHMKTEEVFGVCAAAALYRKSIFEEVGGFDEDYFCYFEDVDLSLRLRLAGYRCLQVAEAAVHHIGSSSSGGEKSEFAVYHGARNLVWTYFKSMPLGLLLFGLPLHVLFNAAHVWHLRKWGLARLALGAKLDALKSLPKILKKRRKVQTLKRISSLQLLKMMGRY